MKYLPRKQIFKLAFLLSAVILTALIFFPKLTLAEIATTRDWIGLFTVDNPNHVKTSPGALEWIYSSNCSTTVPTTPKLADTTGCVFPTPTTDGAYEFRMYANDATNSAGLLAQSKPFWKPFRLFANCSLTSANPPALQVNLNWQQITGINQLKLYRKDALGNSTFIGITDYNSLSASDTIANPGQWYTYDLVASNNRDTKTAQNAVKVTVSQERAGVFECSIDDTLPPQYTPPPSDPTPTASAIISCPTGERSIRSDGFLSFTTANPLQLTKLSTTSNRCLISDRAKIMPPYIPTYEETQSLYYDQANLSNKTSFSGPTDISLLSPTATNNYHLFLIKNIYNSSGQILNPGNLIISTTDNSLFTNDAINPSVTQPIVIFVQGNLNINKDIKYGNRNANSGLIFVVQGDVNIDPTIIEIDAMIITFGQFCSAYSTENSNCPAPSGNQEQLVINGAVISLSPTHTPKFVRSLIDNSCADCAAEKIVYQPKNLVIFRGIFSRDRTLWNEIQ